MTESGQAVGEALAQIASEVKVCTLCELSRTRTHAVPGEGDPHARVMLIGRGRDGMRTSRANRSSAIPASSSANSSQRLVLPAKGVHHQRRQMPSPVQSRSAAGRDSGVLALSGTPDRRDRSRRDRDPGALLDGEHFPGERISRIHGEPKRLDAASWCPCITRRRRCTKATCAAISRPISRSFRVSWPRSSVNVPPRPNASLPLPSRHRSSSPVALSLPIALTKGRSIL